jgi:hypothetical protein
MPNVFLFTVKTVSPQESNVSVVATAFWPLHVMWNRSLVIVPGLYNVSAGRGWGGEGGAVVAAQLSDGKRSVRGCRLAGFRARELVMSVSPLCILQPSVLSLSPLTSPHAVNIELLYVGLCAISGPRVHLRSKIKGSCYQNATMHRQYKLLECFLTLWRSQILLNLMNFEVNRAVDDAV